MKLLVETSDSIETIVEENEGKKEHYLSGIFMQAEETNRNGRMYSLPILTRETNRYIEEKVNHNRALGELNHPTDPTINLERVSHMIREMKIDGNHILGKAKVLDTPCGNIVRGLMEGGVKIGVSSRGVGSLIQKGDHSEVGDDFQLAAVDVVYDPSAPKAFVESVMESVDWLWNEETKSFVRSETEKNNEASAHSWFSTLVDMKADLRHLQEKTMFLMDENQKLRVLIEEKTKKDVQRKERKIEQLIESTKKQIEENVSTKLREKREEKTLEIFDRFLSEISKH